MITITAGGSPAARELSLRACVLNLRCVLRSLAARASGYPARRTFPAAPAAPPPRQAATPAGCLPEQRMSDNIATETRPDRSNAHAPRRSSTRRLASFHTLGGSAVRLRRRNAAHASSQRSAQRSSACSVLTRCPPTVAYATLAGLAAPARGSGGRCRRRPPAGWRSVTHQRTLQRKAFAAACTRTRSHMMFTHTRSACGWPCALRSSSVMPPAATSSSERATRPSAPAA